MKIVFAFLLFYVPSLFCMNSTENRQCLADVSLNSADPVSRIGSARSLLSAGPAFTLFIVKPVDINLALDSLHAEALNGNSISAMAYEMYLDFISHLFPLHLENSAVCQRLISSGLCRVDDGGMRFAEYGVSDRLPILERAAIREIIKIKTNKKQ